MDKFEALFAVLYGIFTISALLVLAVFAGDALSIKLIIVSTGAGYLVQVLYALGDAKSKLSLTFWVLSVLFSFGAFLRLLIIA